MIRANDKMITRRSLFIILVVATVAVFVGLVWLIATLVPWNLSNNPKPSDTSENLPSAQNCTYPVSYWREHPEDYPAEIVLGEKVFQREDLRVFLASESPELNAHLQAQLIGAFLNVQSGASPSSIEGDIFQAYQWLIQHPDGTQMSNSDRDDGSRLDHNLEAYNLGTTGVTACQANSSIISTRVSTATIFSVITPSPIPTLTPSATPSPTNPSITAVQTVMLASQTPRPTTEQPGGSTTVPTHTLSPSMTSTPKNTTEVPIVTPSRTSAPSVTDTPIITTQAPSATATEAPPPSDTPTIEPSPSPRPTLTAPVPTPTNPPLP